MTKLFKNLLHSFLAISISITAINAANTKTKCTGTTLTKDSDQTVREMGENTLEFIEKLDKALPKIIKDIKSSKMKINASMLRTLFTTYKGIKLSELVSLITIKRDNLDDRLTIMGGYLAIEALLITAISNLEHEKTEDNKKAVDDYVKKIKSKIKKLRETLHATLIKELDIKDNSLKKIDASTKTSKTATEILETCKYEELPNFLNIEKDELKNDLIESMGKIASSILTPTDQTKLNSLLKGPLFTRIIGLTDASKLTLLVNGMLGCLPAGAQILATEAREKILAKQLA